MNIEDERLLFEKHYAVITQQPIESISNRWRGLTYYDPGYLKLTVAWQIWCAARGVGDQYSDEPPKPPTNRKIPWVL